MPSVGAMKKENGTRIAVAITPVRPGIAPTVMPANTPIATMPSASNVSAIEMPSMICSITGTGSPRAK